MCASSDGKRIRAKPSKGWVLVLVEVLEVVVVMVVVSLIMLIITITAISNNVTEVHDGTYRVVIPSRPSAPQLSQQIPTDGRLACNKPAVQCEERGPLQHNWCTWCYRADR